MNPHQSLAFEVRQTIRLNKLEIILILILNEYTRPKIIWTKQEAMIGSKRYNGKKSLY